MDSDKDKVCVRASYVIILLRACINVVAGGS